jgi:hypothetical protein
MWNKLEDCYFKLDCYLDKVVFELKSNAILWHIYIFHMPEDEDLQKAFFNILMNAPTVFTDYYFFIAYIRKDSYLNHKFWLKDKL